MKLECCRDQTPTSPLRSSCRQSCSYSSPQITGATPVLEPREEKREPGRSTAPGRREHASSPDRSPRHLPAARGTCSSASGFRVASCAPAGAARAAAGRRVRCTPAATPRSYSCTQRAAAAPTCCPALPWPANPGTAGPEGTRRGKALRSTKRTSSPQPAPRRSLDCHLWQRLWKAGPAVVGAGNKPPQGPATCRTTTEDFRVSPHQTLEYPAVPGVNFTWRAWVLNRGGLLGQSERCPRTEISPGPDCDLQDEERVRYCRHTLGCNSAVPLGDRCSEFPGPTPRFLLSRLFWCLSCLACRCQTVPSLESYDRAGCNQLHLL